MNENPRLTALLGPTNTGKTHFAVERMLAHGSGIIGLPLRLLAREIYDRVARAVGAGAVALITGEEKIAPAGARYFVCTVESMPLHRRVAFVAIDEIQLAADTERGHVFTDRILNARGLDETLFLGADTMRSVLRRLVPGVAHVSRPRLSQLAYAGRKKLARLPPRSAVVAFSAADVYALAEILRRQRGGAAVVLGALSPRTRNAQVALYQAGEVDYLVATDAIGMGLNMDVNLVAFGELTKFDGQVVRALTVAELAQIAGRAGRHLNDGRFGTTAEAPGLLAETVEAIENHRFPRLRAVYWRNARPSTHSLAALLRGLEDAPKSSGLMRAPVADDYRALCELAHDPEITRRASTPDAVQLFWDVCRIPDFCKTMADTHVRLLGRIFRCLIDGGGRLPEDWVARSVERLDRSDGDIDTLMMRIAHIRTWTYISHRSGWLTDAACWRERTRTIEDRLSDTLHDRLNQRFVDRRSALLMRGVGKELTARVDDDGVVAVGGHFMGRLEGFRFRLDSDAEHGQIKKLFNAARRALRGEINRRATHLAGDGPEAFHIDEQARVLWRGEAVARLCRGPSPLAPRLVPLASELLDGAALTRIEIRVRAWFDDHMRSCAGPLLRARDAQLSGPARGVLFQIAESLGALPRCQVQSQIAALTKAERGVLAAQGVRLGLDWVYLAAMLRPRQLAFRALLWAVSADHYPVPAVPTMRAVPADPNLPPALYEAIGYAIKGPRAIRVDSAERVSAWLRRRARRGAIVPTSDLVNMCVCETAELPAVLLQFGYRAVQEDGGLRLVGTKKTASRQSLRRRRNPDSPFAKLAVLNGRA